MHLYGALFLRMVTNVPDAIDIEPAGAAGPVEKPAEEALAEEDVEEPAVEPTGEVEKDVEGPVVKPAGAGVVDPVEAVPFLKPAGERVKEPKGKLAGARAKGGKEVRKGPVKKGKGAVVDLVGSSDELSGSSEHDDSGDASGSDSSVESEAVQKRKGKSTKRSKAKEKERADRKRKNRVAKEKSKKKGKGRAVTDSSGSDSDVYEQTPGDVAGLDIMGNPLLVRFETKAERALLKLGHPQGDVDWREGVSRPVITPTTRRAAFIQQVGILAPPGQACGCCARVLGPFATCQVAIVEGQLHFNGACANCAWGGASGRCSFRSGPLPAFIYYPLLAANPDCPDLLRGCAADKSESEVEEERPVRGTPARKRRLAATAEPESASKRARVADPKGKGKQKVAASGAKVAVPRGPDYNKALFNTVLKDRIVLKKDWEGIRAVRKELDDVSARALWESRVLKALLVKNGEDESAPASEEENIYEGLDISD